MIETLVTQHYFWFQIVIQNGFKSGFVAGLSPRKWFQPETTEKNYTSEIGTKAVFQKNQQKNLMFKNWEGSYGVDAF